MIPGLAYSFSVTPCTTVELDLWDQMVLMCSLVEKHKLPRSFPRACLRKTYINLAWAPPSMAVEQYYSRSLNALIDSLYDTK
jgi:hypothetical protein